MAVTTQELSQDVRKAQIIALMVSLQASVQMAEIGKPKPLIANSMLAIDFLRAEIGLGPWPLGAVAHPNQETTR